MQCRYLCQYRYSNVEKKQGHIEKLQVKKNEELTKIVASLKISLLLSARESNPVISKNTEQL